MFYQVAFLLTPQDKQQFLFAYKAHMVGPHLSTPLGSLFPAILAGNKLPVALKFLLNEPVS